MSNLPQITIQPMDNQYFSKMLQMEKMLFDKNGWDEERFAHLKQDSRNSKCHVMSVAHQGTLAGYMCYVLERSELQLLHFVVVPSHQRRGIGREMFQHLLEQLGDRNEIILKVREYNIDAQLFFQKMGFHRISTLGNHYKNPSQDGYLMRYQSTPEVSSGGLSKTAENSRKQRLTPTSPSQ